ncbi:unnamed protein product [Prorocentrum cordatum]|uniref:Ricin B lectin domain-containing protein n=1 Tax=Prorocentrum cordatum TaxID=2364126 RepID=A0ABN9SVZ6_9DINO|nr:unnamed protein product [Polarella glacialis]
MDGSRGPDGPAGWPDGDGGGLSADEPLTGGAVPPRRAGWRRSAAGAAVPLLVVGAWLAPPAPRARAPRRADGAGAEGKAERGGCLRSEEDVDYWTQASLYEISDTKSEQLCAERCAADSQCGAWTWGKKRGVTGLTDVCFLKKLGETEKPDKRKSKGVVSGLRPDSSCTGPAQVSADAGWVKSKHGICLSAPESGVLGDKVHMSSCDIGDEDQLWTFDKVSGQIRLSRPRPSAPEGVCLTAKAGDVEYSMVLIEKCEDSNGNQQWSYSDTDSQIVLWFGLCLNAPEPASDSSSVDMRVCDRRQAGQRWAIGKKMGRLYYDDRSYVDKELAGRYQSLFCFALMLPGSYEEELLSWQLRKEASLFACDAVAIYSNKAVSLGPGVTTRVVDSSLKCDMGGEFQTALNLPIFLVVWTKVIEDGYFMAHDWILCEGGSGHRVPGAEAPRLPQGSPRDGRRRVPQQLQVRLAWPAGGVLQERGQGVGPGVREVRGPLHGAVLGRLRLGGGHVHRPVPEPGAEAPARQRLPPPGGGPLRPARGLDLLRGPLARRLPPLQERVGVRRLPPEYGPYAGGSAWAPRDEGMSGNHRPPCRPAAICSPLPAPLRHRLAARPGPACLPWPPRGMLSSTPLPWRTNPDSSFAFRKLRDAHVCPPSACRRTRITRIRACRSGGCPAGRKSKI